MQVIDQALFQGTYEVTKAQVDFYRANGYVYCPGVLSMEEVETLRTALAEAMEKRAGHVRDLAAAGEDISNKQDKILQMLNLWEHSDVFKAYATSPRLAAIAQRLTGSDSIHLFHDQALVKKPGPSAPSPWHQDQPYWPSKEGGMLSCWMALDDVTVDRGAMHFIPESHTWGEFDPVSFTGDGEALFKQLPEDLKSKWTPVPVEYKAGDCTWHHGQTFHFTRPNTTPQTRRAIATIYIPDGVNYAADEKMEHPFSPTITSLKGEPLRGSKFLRLI